ncbi:hypothetical protein [Peromfec virus RodF8_48]|uniref:EF-hand domain-containing protein n=1 Tax=Peromfec virus RodF8_48 TaxID=2929379 RepID=A0A976R541_9VIRU|nr:hypothetical protein [Peromfec virus RodF8_48]
MWNWLLDFVKALFNRAYKKDRWTIEQVHSVFDTLLSFIDSDNSGSISYYEIIKMLNDLFRNLHNTRGGN